MKLSVQLDTASLYKLARRSARKTKQLREKLIKRTTEGRQFAVWEVPYSQPEAIKNFIEGLRDTFPPQIMDETLFFVNNGNGGAYQAYLAAGFPAEVFPHVQGTLNSIVGVIRNFNMAPEMLIALSVQGLYEMESRLTPAKVDRAYGGNVPHES